jgi:hypothetical protein
MDIQISQKSKIYTLCPAFSVTGGPEAVHQLTDMLRRFGHDARIVFLPFNPDPTLLEYAAYDIDYSNEIEDDTGNVLIALEVMPNELFKYKRIQKAIWWLSVDNQFKHEAEKRFDWEKHGGEGIHHFAQSYYAYNYLLEQGVTEPKFLSAYLHQRYLKPMRGIKKKNQVAYFAKKNRGVVEDVVAASPDVKWVPIENMNTQQVRSLLAESKVYLDLGPHPGRDRMPREAAMQNCCVLVGNRGAAANAKDYPFPEQFKIRQDSLSPIQIAEIIKSCLWQYEYNVDEFTDYKKWICNQERDMKDKIAEYFGGMKYKEKSEWFVKIWNYYVYYKNKILKKIIF